MTPGTTRTPGLTGTTGTTGTPSTTATAGTAAGAAAEEDWGRLVRLLDERGIVLRTTGDRLGYLAPPGALDEEAAGLVRAHRDRLLAVLTGSGAALSAAPAGLAQRRLYGTHRRSADPAVWNITQRITLRGPLDPERLAAALTALTDRHESLRTRYRDTDLGVLQQVLPNTPTELPYDDLRALAPAARDAALAEAARAEGALPFDLDGSRLLRARLLRSADEVWVLLLTLHHIVVDGWSLATLLGDLGALYHPTGPLPEPGRMTDHACWERTVVTPAAVAEALDHWTGVLGGVPLEVALPTARPRPEQRSGSGGTLGFRVPAALAEAVHRYAAGRSTTASAVLLAGYARLLGELTGAAETLVLLAHANRTRPIDERLVGLLTFGLPIRLPTRLPGGFAALVDAAATAVATALDHATVPVGQLVDQLRERGVRLPASYPQVQLTLLSTPAVALDLPGLTAEVEDVPGPSTRSDLLLVLIPDADGYAGMVEYDADLFEPATVRSWLDALLADLAGQLAD
ncbi:condensation domain-containing protein [Kitasatospora sp. NPDC089797]|uniref:condensation domain-containing protein n=1 Tax=Kitasatospora sp. NPDC089797 TaxID=3155298 RepID=UPI00343EEF20